MKFHKVFVVIVFAFIFAGCGSRVGVVKYNADTLIGTNKELGKDVSIAILAFPDKRYDSNGRNTLIGTVYGGYKNPLIRIYSEKTINQDVMNALENLFKANGCCVKKYPNTTDLFAVSDERLVVRGQINKFWTECMVRQGAVVDIDLEIYDMTNKKKLWSGKIEGFEKRGMGGGIFQDTDVLVLLLNVVLANAIEEAWNNNGMSASLKNLKD